MSRGNEITAGLPLEDALRIFHENVNRPDTTFSRDHWLLPKFARLRQLLSDPITAEQARALLDVLYDRRRMSELIDWLEAPPMGWLSYPAYQKFQQEFAAEKRRPLDPPTPPAAKKETAERVVLVEKGKNDFLPKARPCPRCGTPPEYLEWYNWQSSGTLGGSRGVATRCKFCLAKVDSFVTLHWSCSPGRLRNSKPETVQ